MKNNKEAFRIFCYILLEVFYCYFFYTLVCVFIQNNYYLNYKEKCICTIFKTQIRILF